MLNRLACHFRHDDYRNLDVSGYGVKVDGKPVTEVNVSAARDLLDHPFATVEKQTATLHRLLRWAQDRGGYYELPVVRTRFLGSTTVAALRVEQVGPAHWAAFWWFDA